MPVTPEEIDALNKIDDQAEGGGQPAADKQQALGYHSITPDDIKAANDADDRALEDARDEFIHLALGESLRDDADKKANILSLSKATGVHPEVVSSQYDQLFEAWQLSGRNARQFREKNPALAQMIYEHEETADLAVIDEHVGWLGNFLRTMGGTSTLYGKAAAEREKESAPPVWAYTPVSELRKMPLGERTLKFTLNALLMLSAGEDDTPSPEDVQLAKEKIKRAQGVLPPNKVLVARTPESEEVKKSTGLARLEAPWRALQDALVHNDYNKANSRILAGEIFGWDTWEDEKRAVGLSNQLIRKDYGSGWEQFLTDAVVAVGPSQVEMGKGFALGFVPTAALTRNPVSAYRAGKLTAAAFTFNLELGNYFSQIREARTPDGKQVPKNLQHAGSLMYAGLSTAIEMWSFDPAFDAFGPIGKAFREGKLAQWVRGAMNDPRFQKVALKTLARYGERAGKESIEEVSQNVLSDVMQYLSLDVSTEKPIAADPYSSAERALDAGWEALKGTALLGGVQSTIGLAAVPLWQRIAASRHGQSLLTAIHKGTDESPTRKGAADAVADMIEKETTKSGLPVKYVYVDTTAALKYFQSGKTDMADAMSEETQQAFQDALASGDKAPIPTAEYLGRWREKVGTALDKHIAIRNDHLTTDQLEKIDKLAEDFLEKHKDLNIEPESKEEYTLIQDLEKNLRESGLFDNEKDIQHQVLLHRSFLRAMGEAFDKPVNDLFKGYTLNVGAAETPMGVEQASKTRYPFGVKYKGEALDVEDLIGDLSPENLDRIERIRRGEAPDDERIDYYVREALIFATRSLTGRSKKRGPALVKEIRKRAAEYAPWMAGGQLVSGVEDADAKVKREEFQSRIAEAIRSIPDEDLEPVLNVPDTHEQSQFLFQSRPTRMWYSQVKEAVASSRQFRNSPQAWLNHIRNRGGKREELEFLGLPGWLLAHRGSVTRDDIIDYIQQHELVLEEKGVDHAPYSFNSYQGYTLHQQNPGMGKDAHLIPGTYREIKFFAPTSAARHYISPHFRSDAGYLAHARITGYKGKTGEKILLVEEIQSDLLQDEQVVKDLKNTGTLLLDGKSYDEITEHEVTPEANALSMVMEEIKTKDLDQALAAAEQRIRSEKAFAVETFDRNERWWISVKDEMVKENPEAKEDIEKQEEPLELGDARFHLEWISSIEKAWQSMNKERFKFDKAAVPLEHAWQSFVAKRLIRYAVDNGYTRIAWTTGSQQIERYDFDNSVTDEAKRERMKKGMRTAYDVKLPSIMKHVLGPFGGKVEQGGLNVLPATRHDILVYGLNAEEAYKQAYNAEPNQGLASALSFAYMWLKELQDDGLTVEEIVKEIAENDARMSELGADVRNATLREIFGPWVNDLSDMRTAWNWLKRLTPMDITFKEGQDNPKGEVWHAQIPKALADTVSIKGMPLFQSEEAGPRGFMSREGRDFFIGLTHAADKSTFLHETAHYFLDLFGDLVEREDAPARVKADYKVVLDWFGVTDRSQIETKHHEMFARGFEARLRGKDADIGNQPPSAALRRAFERFRIWLTRVYKSAGQLAVDLPPDIKGVMDRLVATEEEISHSRAAMGDTGAIPRELLGLNPDEYERYIEARTKALSSAARRTNRVLLEEQEAELSAWWREEEQRLRGQAEAEYEALPERRAWLFLRGKLEEFPEPVMLNRAAVVAAIGEERARRFLTAKDGVSPDEPARTLGFPDGATMLQAADTLPSKTVWARERASQLMREKHPDLLQDRAALKEKISKLLHSDKTAKWMEQEYIALRKLRPGDPPTPARVIKEAALRRALGLKLHELQPSQALASERQAADRFAKAAAEGNFELAIMWAEKRVYSMYRYRAMRDLREEMDKAEENVAKRVRNTNRRVIGKVSENMLAVNDGILAAVGMGPERMPKMEVLARYEEARQEAKDDAAPFMFDEDEIRLLLAEPKAWKDLTVTQARNVRNALRNIKAIANAVTKVEWQKTKQKVNDIVAAIKEESKALPDLGSARQQKTETLKRIRGRFIGVHGDLVDPEYLLETLGPTAHNMYEEFLQRLEAKFNLSAEVLDPLLEKLKNVPPLIAKQRFKTLKDIDKDLPWPNEELEGERDMMWLIMLGLNMGNSSNREALPAFGWTEEQVLAVMRKHFVKDHWDLLQSIWDLFDQKLWPALAAKERRKSGLPPGKIEATAIDTPWGTYAGGYFPRVYDPDVTNDVGERQATRGIAALFDMRSYFRASTQKSHIKERVENYSNILFLDWSVFPSQVAQVIHDITFDEWVRDTARIVFHPKMQSILVRRHGKRRKNELREWLKFVANAQVASGSLLAQGATSQEILGLKGTMVVQAIGWAANILMSDFSNAFVAMGMGMKQGGTSFRWGIPAYLAAFPLTGPAYLRARKFALKHSGYLRSRNAMYSNERRERFLREWGADRGPLSRLIAAVGNTAWFLMEHTDKMSSTQIWLARYWQETIENKTPPDVAVKRANRAVRQSLPTPENMEKPSIARNPGALGGLLVFFGYFNKVYNMLYGRLLGDAVRNFVQFKRQPSAVEAAKLTFNVSRLAGRSLATVFFSNVVAEWFASRGPEDKDTLAEWATYKMLAGYANPAPFGAALEPAIRKMVTGRTDIDVSPRAAPVMSLMASGGRAVGTLLNDKKSTPDRVWAGVELALMSAGKIPVRQSLKTSKYLFEVLAGEREVEDPFEAASGIAFGERDDGKQGDNPFQWMHRKVQGEE